jgi:hypothetical protein
MMFHTYGRAEGRVGWATVIGVVRSVWERRVQTSRRLRRTSRAVRPRGRGDPARELLGRGAWRYRSIELVN